MAGNSLPRRVLKRLLFPRLAEPYYTHLQALVMAWDIRTGALTEPELAVIPLAVRAGETAVDIGANYGLYTYHLSRAVGGAGRVYAFEPIPFTNEALQLVARILRIGNAEIVPKGCGDETRTVAFTVPVQPSGAIAAGLAHLSARRAGRGADPHLRAAEAREFSCEVVALDEFLPPVRALTFIKCDIEGAELLALRGAEKVILRHQPTVLCEVNRSFLAGFGIHPEELTGFFAGKGYLLYRYDSGSRRLVETGTLVDQADGNYFFVHPCRLDRFTQVLGSAGA